ncbi:solute carrier family 13 member 2, partial [Plakobranchus ocellatus]
MGILADIWKLRTLYIVPVFFLASIPILTEIPESEMPKEARRCLYVLVVMALTWLTESLPIEATALFPMVLFPLMGVMTAGITSGSYLN